MGGDDEGRGGARLRAECLEYVREEPEDLVAGLRVERARRLIGDDEWGAGQDGECDGGPLRLAAGELGGPATRESRIRQPHASEDLRDARGIRAGDGAQLAAQAHQGVQGLDPPLRDEAHAADPGDDALAGQCESRGEPPAEHRQQERLPRSRRATDDDALPRRDLQVRHLEQRARDAGGMHAHADESEHGGLHRGDRAIAEQPCY